MPQASPSQPSIMEHTFSGIPQVQNQRSSFDRSKGHKTTMDAAYLYPVYLQEVVPGDTVSMDATFFTRIATMLYPPMDNIFFDTFWFFIPNRLVWTNWQRFLGERDPDPDSSIDFEVPFISCDGEDTTYHFESMSLGDYFGLPTLVDITPAQTQISSIPFRMYNLIWNEWFRDQNLQDSRVIPKGDGPDYYFSDGTPPPTVIFDLLKRGKRHDYFTSCLPWPQKGDSVAIPLGTTAPVAGTGEALGFTNNSVLGGLVVEAATGALLWKSGVYGQPVGTASSGTYPGASVAAGVTSAAENSGLYTDLSGATAATINELREAFAVQQLLELDARSGTRYVEILKAQWGVVVPDYRLQRPEYLGGSSQRMNIMQVAQTAPTSGTNAMASLAGYGQMMSRSGFHHSFVEHGYIMCLANVRADITYQQGADRHWFRQNRYDFYHPVFAHLGEQAVYEREIYFDPAAQNPPQVFGYQERWAEYRYDRSNVTAAFRSNHPQSLDAWHLALDFLSTPQLDNTFIVDTPPIDRIRALAPENPDGQQFLVDMYFKTRWARLMPVYSVPGLQRL